MPLSKSQEIICSMIFGITLGGGVTTAISKNTDSAPRQAARQADNAIVEKSRTFSLPTGGSVTIFDSPVLGNCINPDLPEAFEVPDLRRKPDPIFPVTLPGGDTVFVSRVPEVKAWVMMIAGFGFVGASLRRRKVIA